MNVLVFLQSRSALLSAAILPLLAFGCSQTTSRGNSAANAPTLSSEGQAHIRGVSDPNAPFTLIDRTKSTPSAAVTESESAAIPCGASTLQMYESSASADGNKRIVTLAFKNRSAETCRLSGYPRIELQDETGTAIASIAIRQTSALTLSGTVVSPTQETAQAPVEVILRPSASATFQIGWSSGEECALVSGFTVEIPAGESTRTAIEPFAVSHPLNVCNSEILITALTTSGAV